jgi:lipoprotein-releasing system ATP-binding protein
LTILKSIGIRKSFGQGAGILEVLKGIELEVQTGEIVAIAGPSGAGKSTLLHILGGLDQPNAGKVYLDDKDVYKLKDKHRAKLRNEKVGFIFQFYHLLPEFTALENVVLPAMVKHHSSQTSRFRGRGLDLLDKVGLAKRVTHKPNQLSGGEQQRVAVARALMNEPQIILCDEPTGNLDSESGQGIIELLVELNKTNQQTLVIVTHDEQVAKRAHRVIHMRDGLMSS